MSASHSLVRRFAAFFAQSPSLWSCPCTKAAAIRYILLSLLGVRSYAGSSNRKSVRTEIGVDAESELYLFHKDLKTHRVLVASHWRAWAFYLESRDYAQALHCYGVDASGLALFSTFLTDADNKAFQALGRDYRLSPMTDNQAAAFALRCLPKIKGLVHRKCLVIHKNSQWMGVDDITSEFIFAATKSALTQDECKSVPKIINHVMRSIDNYCATFMRHTLNPRRGDVVNSSVIESDASRKSGKDVEVDKDLLRNDVIVTRTQSIHGLTQDVGGTEVCLPGMEVAAEADANYAVTRSLAAMAKHLRPATIKYFKAVVWGEYEPDLDAWLESKEAIKRSDDEVRRMIARFYKVNAAELSRAAQLVA